MILFLFASGGKSGCGKSVLIKSIDQVQDAWDNAFMEGLFNRQIDPNNLNLDIEDYFLDFNRAYKRKHGKDVPKRIQDMQNDYENDDSKLSRIFGRIATYRGPATRAGLPPSASDFTIQDLYNPTGE